MGFNSGRLSALKRHLSDRSPLVESTLYSVLNEQEK
jgi:hypothetical protein